jgi:hypothetical protein
MILEEYSMGDGSWNMHGKLQLALVCDYINNTPTYNHKNIQTIVSN